MIKCLIDNQEFSDIKYLHAHLKKLSIKLEDYYTQYLDKRDLLTGEKIEFKNYKQYLKSDFVSKVNLNKWSAVNPDKAIEWAKNFLSERKQEKNLTYAPHHSELRTLFCPNVKFFEKFSDYNQICESIGLTKRFDYKKELKFTPLPIDYKIVIDTREQKPLALLNKVTGTLKFGDYALDGNNSICFERKSLSDLVGTLGKGYERFCRELQRAKEAGSYLIVLVEKDINSALSFHKEFETRYAKVTPEHIFRNMRELIYQFDNVQFVFAKDRKESARVMMRILELGEQTKTTDLQYMYEVKKL